MRNFFDLTYQETMQLFNDMKLQKFRVTQLWQGIYKELKTSPAEITTIGKKLSNQLTGIFSFENLKTMQLSKTSDC